MTAYRRAKSRRRHEQGYALLLVIFMATMLLILATMAAPNIKTEGQREKEKEMIWRGKQYTRGIKLYYRKLGHFPTSLDDLTKPKIGSLRFMRQAYKDPMNAQDGSWRLIYVGPAGQLVGSLKPQPQNLQFGQPAGMGTPAAAMGSLGGGSGASIPNSGFGSVLGQAIGQVGSLNNPQGQAGTQPGSSSAFGSNPSNPQNPTSTTGPAVSADQSTGPSTDTPIPTDDPPTIMGGNIIGVGSKINKKSIMVYDKAKNYRLFEFIWDPSKDTFGMGQPGMQPGAGIGQPIGQPIGGPPPGLPGPSGGSPGAPSPNPPNPQNPQPQNPQQQ